MTIAILGGTGPEGLGLAARAAQSGLEVLIGSRSATRAAEAAAGLRVRLPRAEISGATNPEAAEAADTVCIAVPYAGLDQIVASCGGALRGKTVIDTIVPLRVRGGYFDLEPVPEGSASQRLQSLLPECRVVSAFKNQSAIHLQELDRPVEGDVLLCGDDESARRFVAELVRRIPNLRPVDAGDLRAAHAIEQITALLLNLNRRHRIHASIRLTGI